MPIIVERDKRRRQRRRFFAVGNNNTNVLKMGGILFFIDDTATGEYRFWNENGVEVEAPAVGTDCTGWTYTVKDANKDKYYCYNDEYKSDCRWTYNKDDAFVHNEIAGLSNSIGAGKNNTSLIMQADAGAYITDDSDGKPTVWYLLKAMNDNKVGGCDNWYVPSRDEAEELRKAITFTVITTEDEPVIMQAGAVTGGSIASTADGQAWYVDYDTTRTCYPSNTAFRRRVFYSSSQQSANNTIAWKNSRQTWAGNDKKDAQYFFAIMSI